MPQNSGIFTVSLDVELIWGTLDKHGPSRFWRLCEDEKAVVIDSILALFAEFDVSATWCVLGHLFLDHCSPEHGMKHPEIVRPIHKWMRDDWFCHDPCGTEDTHPLFYGRSMIEKIRNCKVYQEIGCHTFSHVIFGDKGCSRATAETELDACVQAARALGLEMRSFAFPRNRIGYLQLLRAHGFTSFRGPEPHWYEKGSWPRKVKRSAHLFDIVTARTPPTVTPEQVLPGLWNIPGSMLLTPSHGLRRHIPISRRVTRAQRGLDAAVRDKRIFHLWFHPTDLAANVEGMLSGLRQILEYSAKLRSRNKLEIVPMGSLVPSPSLSHV